MAVALKPYIHGLKYFCIKLFLEKVLKDILIKAYLLYMISNNLASFLLSITVIL